MTGHWKRFTQDINHARRFSTIVMAYAAADQLISDHICIHGMTEIVDNGSYIAEIECNDGTILYLK